MLHAPHRSRNGRAAAVWSLAVALGLALTACGAGPAGSGGAPMPMASHPSASPSTGAAGTSSGSSVSARHNAADVKFAQDMIAHHRGAIEMATLATTRASSAMVKSLAESIRDAQQPEIEVMTAWLQAWGRTERPDPSSMSPMPGMAGSTMAPATDGQPSSGAMGMMTQSQMDQLAAASGTAFDRLFLQLMTVHHDGAIDMARTEQTAGSNPQAKALADSIVISQSAQVTQVQQMLTG